MNMCVCVCGSFLWTSINNTITWKHLERPTSICLSSYQSSWKASTIYFFPSPWHVNENVMFYSRSEIAGSFLFSFFFCGHKNTKNSIWNYLLCCSFQRLFFSATTYWVDLPSTINKRCGKKRFFLFLFVSKGPRRKWMKKKKKNPKWIIYLICNVLSSNNSHMNA